MITDIVKNSAHCLAGHDSLLCKPLQGQSGKDRQPSCLSIIGNSAALASLGFLSKGQYLIKVDSPRNCTCTHNA